jgi:hypothetical protein
MPEGAIWMGQCPKCACIVLSIAGHADFVEWARKLYEEIAGKPEFVARFERESQQWRRL